MRLLRRGKNGILQDEFLLPTLEALHKNNGSSTRKKCLETVESLYGDQFTDDDIFINESRNVCRWETNVEWNIFKLKKLGIVKTGSPIGIWELN